MSTTLHLYWKAYIKLHNFTNTIQAEMYQLHMQPKSHGQYFLVFCYTSGLDALEDNQNFHLTH